MDNNETILTEEQINQVTQTLEENKNETDKLLVQIEKEHENDDNSNAPLEEGEGQYIADGVIIGDGESQEDDNFSNFDNMDISTEEAMEQAIKTNITDKFDITDEEAIKFADVIARVRSKEKFNIYNELPSTIKKYIDDTMVQQNVPLKDRQACSNYVAKMFIDELVSDAEFDAISIDLEKAMKEMIPAPLEMYSEVNKEYIENKFVEIADKIKSNENSTDKELRIAEKLLAMRKGYIDAYSFEPMYELFKDSKILNKVRKAEKLWSRVDEEYKRIASVCKFKLYPLNEVRNSLIALGLSKTNACRVSALFVYTYTDGIKNPDDIYKNSFANYFEMNIKNLAISPNIVSDFSKEINENLLKLSNHIEDAVVARERELLSNKKKRG